MTISQKQCGSYNVGIQDTGKSGMFIQRKHTLLRHLTQNIHSFPWTKHNYNNYKG